MRSLWLPVPAVVLATVALAQQLPYAFEYRGYPVDSGFLDNLAAQPAAVFAADVCVATADWLQLWFGACNLPPGSRLLLRSLQDHAEQRFEAQSLREWSFVSAYFNGGSVRVELWAAPQSRGNRLLLEKVKAGIGVGVDTGICGGVDTRLLSNDPWVGRIDGGCSAWLANEFTLLTAGHCLGAVAGQIVHFNVPLSTATGAPQFPPPEDQYALEPGVLYTMNLGVGADYSVFAAVRNSNTGLYPGQAQHGWYPAAPPPVALGQQITVTGYGSVSPPVSPTWNGAQKTATGPRVASAWANSVGFQVHVTGGNSGSPVIDAGTGIAIGIATHAGCGSVGYNLGTSLGLASLATALQQVMVHRTAGSLATFGQGCGSGAGTPAIGFAGVPDLGQTVMVQVQNVDPSASRFGTMLFGFSQTQWAGGALPAALGPYGLQGCVLLVSGEVSAGLFTNFGNVAWPLAIPNAPALVAMTVYCQYFASDPAAPNLAQLVGSNGGRIAVGN